MYGGVYVYEGGMVARTHTTHGWEHNGQLQASMGDNRRKAFMYSTNFSISKNISFLGIDLLIPVI